MLPPVQPLPQSRYKSLHHPGFLVLSTVHPPTLGPGSQGCKIHTDRFPSVLCGGNHVIFDVRLLLLSMMLLRFVHVLALLVDW